MQRLAEQVLCFGRGQDREKFEKQRQIVGQFAYRNRQAVLLVEVGEIDHRLSAFAAFAVDMLEQMQGQRTGAVEQQNIAFLQIEQIAVGDLRDQRRQRLTGRLRHQSLAFEHGGKLRRGGLQLRRRIGQQRRQNFEGLRHQNTSVGVLTLFLRGAPNRLACDVPPEQSLPKLNPHEPRIS